jgi:D-serine deaminase-like pyridoxal phosphate-dependent protein
LNYHFEREAELDSPSLVYYEDAIRENIRKAIGLAGGPERLWPHVKTHKMASLVRIQLEMGITRFKCAAISEAEMTASCGAGDVLVAYPLVGPAIQRFIRLCARYAATRFWAIGDDLGQLTLLGKTARDSGGNVPVLIDVNLGMNRTGVSLDTLEDFYHAAAQIPGISVRGFHGYDGHLGIKDPDERKRAVAEKTDILFGIKSSLENQGFVIPVLVMGGTPTFPCHAKNPGVFLSPGTFFVQDHGYDEKYRDLTFIPGAALLCRVVSHPAPSLFTIDAGSKAVASDPQGDRGIIAGMNGAKPVAQSEEHWVFRMESGEIPAIGTILYVIPTHICPTTALYPGAYVVEDGKLVNYWEVTARNRRLTI